MNTKRSFLTLSLMEVWERFGYYGMASIMLIHMVKNLHFDDATANLTWGAFSALVYITPTIGGWIGDKFLGSRRSLLLGAGILFLGYLLLALPIPGAVMMLIAMSVICVGNGLFKPNAGNMVRALYKNNPTKLDAAFTLYYMAINVGSTLATLAAPLIMIHWGWHYAFLAAAIGMILSMLQALIAYKSISHVGNELDEKPLNWSNLLKVLGSAVVAVGIFAWIINHSSIAKILVFVTCFIVVGAMLYLLLKAKKGERSGLIVAYILCLQALAFWVFFQQISTSLTFFALRNVDNDFHLFNTTLFTFSAPQYQSLETIGILILSPFLTWIYRYSDRNEKEAMVSSKYALGFICLTLTFAVFAISGSHFSEQGKVSSWAMMLGYFLFALSELFISSLGMSMISRFTPARMSGFMMGVWLLTLGVGMYLGSLVANFAQIPKDMTMSAVQSMPLYVGLFNRLTTAALIIAIISLAMMPWLRRLSKNHVNA